MLQLESHNNLMEVGYYSKNGTNRINQRVRLNRRSLVILVCLFSLGAVSAYAQDLKPRIAVLDLYDACNQIRRSTYDRDRIEFDSKANAKQITSIFVTELVNSNKYRVVERSRIDQIIEELGLQSTQDVSVRAAEIGRLLGVPKIITGEYSCGRSYSTTSIRLIDVESGEIERAITFENTKLYIRKISRKEMREYKKYGISYDKRSMTRQETGNLTSPEIAEKILIELFK
jgi:curli biogenesis system outer membrane secretion channel CsgG